MSRHDVLISKDILSRIQATTSLQQSFWDELQSGLSAGDSPASVRIRESSLSLLASEVDLDAENLGRGEVDFAALSAHQKGDITRLPEKYSHGFSRIRTSGHLFDQIEAMHGWRARMHLLRKLQVTEAIIADPELLINVQFITDACEEMSSMGIRTEQFFRMGRHSTIRNYHTVVGEKFRETRSVRELHERCFAEVLPEHYDQNSVYQVIFSDHDRIIVKIRPSPDVCDQLGTLWIGNQQTCTNRGGAFASLPGYKRLPFSEVHETRCIHRGDPTCVYEIVFNKMKPLSALDQVSVL